MSILISVEVPIKIINIKKLIYVVLSSAFLVRNHLISLGDHFQRSMENISIWKALKMLLRISKNKKKLVNSGKWTDNLKTTNKQLLQAIMILALEWIKCVTLPTPKALQSTLAFKRIALWFNRLSRNSMVIS